MTKFHKMQMVGATSRAPIPSNFGVCGSAVWDSAYLLRSWKKVTCMNCRSSAKNPVRVFTTAQLKARLYRKKKVGVRRG